MATVLLARHGETAWNRAGRLQGWAPTDLTDRGRAQARELATAAAARDPDRLVASDLLRARRTAERIGTAADLPVGTDRRWRERDAGRLQGLDAAAVYDRFPRLSLADAGEDALRARPEGGESLAAVRERVLDAWADLRAALDPGATAVVVTHAVPIDAVRAAATGWSFAAAVREGGPDPGGMLEVRIGEDGPSVRDGP
ncbi:MAG: histidine phosphatase family protein [Haloferacaceae archaeon]